MARVSVILDAVSRFAPAAVPLPMVLHYVVSTLPYTYPYILVAVFNNTKPTLTPSIRVPPTLSMLLRGRFSGLGVGEEAAARARDAFLEFSSMLSDYVDTGGFLFAASAIGAHMPEYGPALYSVSGDAAVYVNRDARWIARNPPPRPFITRDALASGVKAVADGVLNANWVYPRQAEDAVKLGFRLYFGDSAVAGYFTDASSEAESVIIAARGGVRGILGLLKMLGVVAG